MVERAPELQPGQILDRYELVCPLATGGMAEVWVARLRGKRGFEKLVAVKTVLAKHAGEPRFQAMFLDEARLIAKIKHPNVAEILDLGEEGGLLFLVLELIDGDSLSTLRKVVQRREQGFPLNVALRILADACAGLHAAHELRDEDGKALDVVHRDFSPANVLVSSAGAVKLIDFGIAKALHRESEETTSGIIKGKLSYMAPEQATGTAVDRRADIWAAGAVLYHLLAGSPPYRGDNQIQLLNQLIHGRAPPPLTGAPPEVTALVMTALERDPNRRFATAEEMQSALEDALVRTCGTTTSSDVARFVTTVIGDRISQQKASVRQAIERADARPDSSSAAAKTPVTAFSDANAAEPRTEQLAVEQSDMTPAPRRGRVVAALVVVGAVGLGAVVLATEGNRRAQPNEPAARAPVAEAESAAALPSAVAPIAPATSAAEPAPAVTTDAGADAANAAGPRRSTQGRGAKKAGSDLFEVFGERR